MVFVELFDKKNLHLLKWPQSESARRVRKSILPMMEEGVERYVKNVKTSLFILQVDHHLLPLTVNDKEYENSYLTSHYYVIHELKEQLAKRMPRLSFWLRPFIKGMGAFLKGIQINKVVTINNWLLTMSFYPDFSEEQIREIKQFLSRKFPKHLLVFRHLDDRLCSDLKGKLRKERFSFFKSRFVQLYDPKSALHSKARYHHRRDRRLLESSGYEVVQGEALHKREIPEVLSLYRQIYHEKHTRYSPQYTEKFIDQGIKERSLHFMALKKEGKLRGVTAFSQEGERMSAPFFGYDRESVDEQKIYRMLLMLAIDEAEKRGVILNDGSGGEVAKQFRGMEPTQEHVAIYARHLPLHRRYFWSLADRFTQKA